MGSRLELKYGLVAEADRLSTSADAMLVNEPATGSKVRSKGTLYLVVSSAKLGGRARDASALVADTVRREYYYDESAGVPICLEKAIRSANRKLRGSREGAGLPPGVLGIAVAIVRQTELYVATIGDAEAYLVRAARLLMPDHSAAQGLPADDSLRVDVWRGEIAVGDSLLLVSRNLTEVVGTEELKNAVVTLHPQSAVEHLHHLFVAAGGDGSDAVLAVEATELAPSRGDRRLAPAGSTDAYGELANGPIPGGQQMMGAANAVTGAFSGATSAVGGAVGGAVDRVLDGMPRRTPSPRAMQPLVSRRESQRRAAIALLALLSVILVLGLVVWIFPHGKEDTIQALTEGQKAFRAAQEESDQASRLIVSDPSQAVTLFQSAWADLQRAKQTGVQVGTTAPLEKVIHDSLDTLYNTHHPRADALYKFEDDTKPVAFVKGPDRAAYYIDGVTRSVWRVDQKSGKATQIIEPGFGPGEGIGTPRLLSAGGPDLLIVDSRNELWRWRVNATGGGSLLRWKLGGNALWGDDVMSVGTLITSSSAGFYNLYIPDPSVNQILKYRPTLDGGGFEAPDNYLTSPDRENVGDFRKLYVDADLYALTSSDVIKHSSGRVQSYSLQTPPDDGDLRPGHDYRYITGTVDKLYVFDIKWGRVIIFNKASGQYLAQWQTRGKQPTMTDVRGMYAFQPARGNNATNDPAPVVYWITPDAIYGSQLVEATEAVVTPPPDASSAPVKTPKPAKTPKPPKTPKP